MAEAAQHARPKILIVEAEPHVRAAAADHLEEEGFEVIEASTGDYAMAVLESRDDISSVFADANLPGRLSGFDIARAALALHPHLSVIVTCASLPKGSSDAVPNALLVRKPYRITEIVSLIRQASSAA